MTTRRHAATRNGRHHAAEAGNDLMTNVKEFGVEAGRAATESLNRVRNRAGEYFEDGRERFVAVERTLLDAVRKNPGKTLLIAAGAAAALALFVSLRNHDE